MAEVEALEIGQQVLEPERFCIDDVEKWLKHFEEEGYVVLKEVAPQERVEKSVDGIWDQLEGLGSGIKRDDLSTWSDANWPGWLHTGFLLSHGIPHSKGDLRSLPAVRQAFASIWKSSPEEMVTSMDILIGWRPWWTSKDIQMPRVERLHVDQSPRMKKGFHCAQGMLLLRDATIETGGLQVVPQSNTKRVQDELASRYQTPMDWCELRPADPYITKNRGRLLLAKAGDFIIWDSRTIHGGFVGSGSKGKEPELARLAQTICMMPKSKLTNKKVYQHRWKMFKGGRGTTHWPNEFARHAANDTGGSNITSPPKYETIALTEDQISLIGGTPPDWVKSASA